MLRESFKEIGEEFSEIWGNTQTIIYVFIYIDNEIAHPGEFNGTIGFVVSEEIYIFYKLRNMRKSPTFSTSWPVSLSLNIVVKINVNKVWWAVISNLCTRLRILSCASAALFVQ